MKISRWVDMGQEVEIDVDFNDIRGALSEAFANVTEDRLGEGRPSAHDVLRAFDYIAQFLRAISDEEIAMIGPRMRERVEKLLSEQAKRFRGTSASEERVA